MSDGRKPIRLRVWIIAAVVVAGLGVAGWYALRTTRSATSSEGRRPDAAANDLPWPATGTPTGPSRLREGVVQTEDVETARVSAQTTLARVEEELAATQDPVEVQRLQRKKQLILEALERLDAAPSE